MKVTGETNPSSSSAYSAKSMEHPRAQLGDCFPGRNVYFFLSFSPFPLFRVFFSFFFLSSRFFFSFLSRAALRLHYRQTSDVTNFERQRVSFLFRCRQLLTLPRSRAHAPGPDVLFRKLHKHGGLTIVPTRANLRKTLQTKSITRLARRGRRTVEI